MAVAAGAVTEERLSVPAMPEAVALGAMVVLVLLARRELKVHFQVKTDQMVLMAALAAMVESAVRAVSHLVQAQMVWTEMVVTAEPEEPVVSAVMALQVPMAFCPEKPAATGVTQETAAAVV